MNPHLRISNRLDPEPYSKKTWMRVRLKTCTTVKKKLEKDKRCVERKRSREVEEERRRNMGRGGERRKDSKIKKRIKRKYEEGDR